MAFIRDQMSFNRMKSITNRLPFRHSSKTIDTSESGISEHIRTEHGHGVTAPSNTVNVVLFGETGVGKSSVINLIAQKPIAKVSSDVNGCTMESTKHDIEFDGRKFAIFDTIGLEEPQMGVNGYLKAIEKAYELITKLNHAGGVHLLLFCMRGGRITATTQSNYRLFCEILCSTKVPIALVFTGLEREVEMEDWWRRNYKHIEGYGIKSDGHACVTAVLDNDTPGEDLKYNESRVVIRNLLKTCALENTAYSPDIISWFTRLGRDMMSLIEKRMSPKRKKVLKVLVKRCKLDPDTAKKIADMMEKGEPDTQPAQSGTVEEVNPPNPGALDPVAEGGNSGDEISDDEGEDHLDHRPSESGVATISPPSDASLLEKATEAGHQAQGRSREGESRSNAESNASGRQETMHAKEHTITSKLVEVDEAGTSVLNRETAASSEEPQGPDSVAKTTPFVRRSSKRSGEESISSSVTKTTSSRSAREDIKLLREDRSLNATSAFSSSTVREGIMQLNEKLVPDDASRPPSPDVRESTRLTREELILESASRASPSLDVKEGIKHSNKELIPDGASRPTPSPGVRRSTRPTEEELVLGGASRAFPSPSIKAGIRPKEALVPGSASRATSSPSVRESTGPTKEEPIPDGTGGALPLPGVREGIRAKEVLTLGGTSRAASSSSVRESIKPTKEELVLDGADGVIPSLDVKEGTRSSRKEPHADTTPSSAPYGIGEAQVGVQPRRSVPNSAGTDKWSAVSNTGGSPGQTKKVSNSDSSWSATGPREVTGPFKRGSNLEVASQAGARVGAAGSTGQSRNPGTGSMVQADPSASLLAVGRGSTGQLESSARRHGATS